MAESFKKFKEAVLNNKKELEEFNTFKNDAENNNMWAEYGEYIASFAQTNMEELQSASPQMAVAIKKFIRYRIF